jgi:hypothetical protein
MNIDSDGWSDSVSSDDSTIISCLFFFFVGHSSTTTTGLAGGESLVKLIFSSIVLFFPGISLILSSHFVWLVVTMLE